MPAPTILPYRHREGGGYGYNEKSDTDKDV